MVRRKELIAVLVLATISLLSCNRPAPQQKRPAEAVPMIEADVLTMRTVTSPQKRERLGNIVVAEGKVRYADELDTWRLLDLEKNSVTFVDVVGESYRTVPLEVLAAEKRSKSAMPLPSFIKTATITSTGSSEKINGVEAVEWVVSMGEYRRELWLSAQPLIHPRFLALSVGSEELGGNYAAAMAPVHIKMMAMEGFPLRELITFPSGNTTMTLERRLEKRGKQRVPRALIEIPARFKDLTKGSADGRPDGASPPSGQGTREAESQSSAKSEKTP